MPMVHRGRDDGRDAALPSLWAQPHSHTGLGQQRWTIDLLNEDIHLVVWSPTDVTNDGRNDATTYLSN